MLMKSAENPSLPCEAEKADLDFEGITREIVEQQEAVEHGITYGFWQARRPRKPVFKPAVFNKKGH